MHISTPQSTSSAGRGRTLETRHPVRSSHGWRMRSPTSVPASKHEPGSWLRGCACKHLVGGVGRVLACVAVDAGLAALKRRWRGPCLEEGQPTPFLCRPNVEPTMLVAGRSGRAGIRRAPGTTGRAVWETCRRGGEGRALEAGTAAAVAGRARRWTSSAGGLLARLGCERSVLAKRCCQARSSWRVSCRDLPSKGSATGSSCRLTLASNSARSFSLSRYQTTSQGRETSLHRAN